MTDFLLLLVFGVCWTWGVHCIFSDGYLLGTAGNYLRAKLPDWILKPTIDCPPCMASVHGILVFVCFHDWHIYPMIFYMVCLCGLNYIIKEKLYPDYE